MGTFLNGTGITDPSPNIYWKVPYYTYTWESWGKIVKCFELKIIHKEISVVQVFMTQDIFPNSTRPQNGGFVVLFHYPNQFWTSFSTAIREWPEEKKQYNGEGFWMTFRVKGMMVESFRYKRDQNNCLLEWKETLFN